MRLPAAFVIAAVALATTTLAYSPESSRESSPAASRESSPASSPQPSPATSRQSSRQSSRHSSPARSSSRESTPAASGRSSRASSLDHYDFSAWERELHDASEHHQHQQPDEDLYDPNVSPTYSPPRYEYSPPQARYRQSPDRNYYQDAPQYQSDKTPPSSPDTGHAGHSDEGEASTSTGKGKKKKWYRGW